ncbi:hypothetical protein [Bacilliculturomica massiliensis]|uniref:hypothetical protein n=1 Tax=Bacilliculturomica massiliensis TaxID=1917867 RepID=UPI001031FDE3|nr:hypothetical protein [Bacilliculturomica massiliensis]
MKYKGILPERKTWIKAAIFIIAGYMLAVEILAGRWAYVPITILVMPACFFKKEQIISEDGVDIQYMLFGRIMHNYWSWDEITTLHVDHRRARPNVMLHIGKGVVTRSYIMDPADCRAVLKLAAHMNPAVYIEDLTEEQVLHREEVRKAQRAAKKQKK